MITFIKILGGLLALTGLFLAFSPEVLVGQQEYATQFEAAEAHTRWGILIGLGILLLVHTQLHPWKPTVAAIGFSISLGYLVARIIGISIEGAVTKQWMWVAIEALLVVVFIALYSKLKKSAA